jgi:GMP synthase-like glutamine amidotransferase
MKMLTAALEGHEVEVQLYHPGLNFNEQDKDLIILSGGGGEGKEVDDYITPNKLWYEDEINFIQNTNKPIIGICMGFELIAAAFGAKVEKMKKGVDGYLPIKVTRTGRKVLGFNSSHQFESHEWHVKRVPKNEFKVFGRSKTGIEIIHHKSRPIFATQFHPEFPDGGLKLEKIVRT